MPEALAAPMVVALWAQLLAEADMRTGQQVTTSVMISVPSSVVKTTSGLLELSGIMPVTSVRVRRPAMRPMEAQAPRGWIMPGGGAVGEAAAAAEGVVAVGINDGVGCCRGWFGSEGGLAEAAVVGNG